MKKEKDNNVFIIAEIGINHNGELKIAKDLIDMAAECGCDAVKFQKRTIDIVYTKDFLDSPRESPWGKTQRDQKEGLEFNKEEYDEINSYCKEKGIIWFASAWDEKSQEFLRQYDLKYNKVASAMLTHHKLLNMIAEEKKYTFISTGMSDYKIIDDAVNVFEKYNCKYELMHCVSTYPSEDEECNLLAIPELKKRYKCKVGYSGHEKGVLPSTIAVVLGATSIERHITLDRTMYGSDQSASLERKGLELLVRDVRRINYILGSGHKIISEKEKAIAKKLRYHEEVHIE